MIEESRGKLRALSSQKTAKGKPINRFGSFLQPLFCIQTLILNPFWWKTLMSGLYQ